MIYCKRNLEIRFFQQYGPNPAPFRVGAFVTDCDTDSVFKGMNIQKLLKEFDLRPKKGLGQNFLIDERVLKRIVAAAEVGTKDTVLEVGPGLGTLTRFLAEEARRVIAVELDRSLVKVLARTLNDCPNVEIVQGDILELNPADLLGRGGDPSDACPSLLTPCPFYKVVANLPYYITSAVLRHLLEAEVKPGLMVVTVQREVAQRLVAGPGQMSLLAVSVRFYGHPRVVARIPAGAFYPSPEVHSAVVRIDLHKRPVVEVDDLDRFFEVVRAGFAQKRKQLRNSLAGGLSLPTGEVVGALRRAGVDERRRAQTLSIEEWGKDYREIETRGR